MILTDKETRESRLSICKNCEFRKNSRCNKCGCFIASIAVIKPKKCPMNKW